MAKYKIILLIAILFSVSTLQAQDSNIYLCSSGEIGFGFGRTDTIFVRDTLIIVSYSDDNFIIKILKKNDNCFFTKDEYVDKITNQKFWLGLLIIIVFSLLLLILSKKNNYE